MYIVFFDKDKIGNNVNDHQIGGIPQKAMCRSKRLQARWGKQEERERESICPIL